MPIFNSVYKAIEGWQPGDNTLAYYPFENDILDVTGNTSLSGTMVKSGLGYKPTSTCSGTATGTTNWISFWIYVNSYPPTSGNTCGVYASNHSMLYYPYHSNSNFNKKIVVFTSSSYNYIRKSYDQPLQTWHWIGIGYNGTKSICTIDGVSYDLGNSAGYNFNNTIGIEEGDIVVSKLILESVCWTADEISDYYNQTKGYYGL